MSPSRSTRITFYSLMIFFGLGQSAIAILTFILTIDAPLAPHLLPFAFLASLFSVVNWIGASILLSYSDKPRRDFFLTRVRTHLWFNAILAFLWLAAFIMLVTRTPTTCELSRPSDGQIEWWCGITVTTTAMAFLLGTLCAILALLFVRSVRRHGKDHLSRNVAHDQLNDGEANHMMRAT
ncbi:hypothetical protein HGRIS_011694 [Hohenbuehelia grisea]|uniref:MARVEL domain-containing protein n=1 Tax=Hohenbuehelia grisea TaxID=104357 RepID=A0ABR3JW22_9AGAR